MKLIKTREESLKENFLELHYNTIDAETEMVLERLKEPVRYIEGTDGERKITLPLNDIFYIETVDRKNFAYTEDACVEVHESLKDFTDEYSAKGFVRIGKSCVVNIHKVKRLEGDMNMRVMVYLKNDEKLVMNRSYRGDFYAALKNIQGAKKNETD
ncbi:MAG: LytTR family transcriptional regulator DNA-binding domain-containing protein [Lachnospiraceae bacterium]|nr:LytTR family transcriptional regulator DNA-binding domain-containing protein [Lachnospiraceae bacterium]